MNNRLYGNLIFELSKPGRKGYSLPANEFADFSPASLPATLVPESCRRRGLAPVGRLDKDTEGLLLLTDDGELTHRLLSPKYHVDKVYYARLSGTAARCV